MTPLSTLIQSKVDDAYYTPDMTEIYSKRRHLLFVYGTLKKGFTRHNLLTRTKPVFVGTAWTVGTYFDMQYTKGTSPFPFILTTHPQVGAKIQGEVYLVKPEAIVSCDFFENNGFMYDRVKAKIETTNIHNPDIPLKIDCWMYEGNRKYWTDRKTRQSTSQADLLTRQKDGAKYYTFMSKYANGTPNATLRSL